MLAGKSLTQVISHKNSHCKFVFRCQQRRYLQVVVQGFVSAPLTIDLETASMDQRSEPQLEKLHSDPLLEGTAQAGDLDNHEASQDNPPSLRGRLQGIYINLVESM